MTTRRGQPARGRDAQIEETFHKGLAYHGQGNLAEAERLYRAVLAADGLHCEALHHLGLVKFQQGRADDAIALIAAALQRDPRLAMGHGNLAMVLQTVGRYAEAFEHFETALRLKPDYADAHANLGTLLHHLGRRDEAVPHYRKALALTPNNPATRRNLASAMAETGQYAGAAAQYRKVLEIVPNDPEAHYGLATSLMDEGRAEEAVRSLVCATRLNAANPLYRWQRCMAHLPIVYRSEDEIETCRNAFATELRGLANDAEAAAPATLAAAAVSVGQARPFYLAYQGAHDRELQAIYGGLVCKVMSALMPQYAQPPRRRNGAESGPIRIGVLSGFFRDHSNWRLPVQGWVENLPRDRFELYGYHSGAAADATTEHAHASFSSFAQGPLALTEWCAKIRADQLDLLIVPETAMDPTTIALAALRLAPVQATSWGHPLTSGLPTMDYFLSSALMEPPDADVDYTEALVRLPHLGVWLIELAEVGAADRDDLGLSPHHVVYWSCQSLYKYLPRHDHLFADIAEAVPNARFLFIRNPSDYVTALFQERLKNAFAKRGMDSETYCRFLGRLDRRQFAAITAAADIFLDNPGWSGCNSTLEAVACGLPTVSWSGDLMRTRHTAAILDRMGMNDLIATTAEDFAQTAIRLGRDPALRDETRQRICAGREALYRDRIAIDGLAEFIERAVAGREPGAK